MVEVGGSSPLASTIHPDKGCILIYTGKFIYGDLDMKILIGADIVPKKAEVNELFTKGDIKTLFNDVADIAQDTDRFIVNLECALTTSE